MTPNTRVQRFEVLKNGTFVIRQVQVQDRGQYLCTAKNLHGVDRTAVLLSVTVQQPQILAAHYQDVTVYLGDTIAMECLAKGTPAPRISWIFPDGRVWHAVSPAEGRVTLHANRTLSIKEASFADRGVYKCVASNAAGADSLALRLHVAALPPVIQQQKLENISLPPGLSIHIHCTAKAAPPPTVRWLLSDGTQVRPSQFLRGNVFVFPNGTLHIRHLAPEDSGRYECIAANLVGSARRAVQLSVQRATAAAHITASSPRRSSVHYGGTLRLHCSASGDPAPRVLWRLPSKRTVDAALFRYVRPCVPRPASLAGCPCPVPSKAPGCSLCVPPGSLVFVTHLWPFRQKGKGPTQPLCQGWHVSRSLTHGITGSHLHRLGLMIDFRPNGQNLPASCFNGVSDGVTHNVQRHEDSARVACVDLETFVWARKHATCPVSDFGPQTCRSTAGVFAEGQGCPQETVGNVWRRFPLVKEMKLLLAPTVCGEQGGSPVSHITVSSTRDISSERLKIPTSP